MTTEQRVARIKFLQEQLALVDGFIANNKSRLELEPGNRSYALSLRTWEDEAGVLQRELKELENNE